MWQVINKELRAESQEEGTSIFGSQSPIKGMAPSCIAASQFTSPSLTFIMINCADSTIQVVVYESSIADAPTNLLLWEVF